MGRRSRDTSGDTFAQIPVRVLVSTAFKTMKARHQIVLVALAAQYRGNNNGDLAFTRRIARHFGITSEDTRCGGLKELCERGLILKAGKGGRKPQPPTTWALTWKAIDYWGGKKLPVVRLPPEGWTDWEPTTTHTPSKSLEGTPALGAVNRV